MMDKETPADYQNPKTTLWTLTSSGSYRNRVTDDKQNNKPKDCLGGILADDMGLGKTLEVIALIVTNPATTIKEHVAHSPPVQVKSPKSTSDPFGFVPAVQAPKAPLDLGGGSIPSKSTLIICPLSTISNWEEQINSHVKEGTLSVYVYHGPGRTHNPYLLASHVTSLPCQSTH